MALMTRIMNWGARVLLGAAAVALLAMVVLVSLSVVMRYGLGSPFSFTEELVALLYLSMVFFTLPIATVRGEHIVVTVLQQRTVGTLRRCLVAGSAAVMVIFALWFTVEAWNFVAFSKQIDARSEQTGLALWPWMAIMPAVMAFVAAIAVMRVLRSWGDRSGHLEPEHPPPMGDRL